ncbi:hypothetical protein BBI17_009309 [Phytophthora kernoviae]|uniref:ODAD1 central coiled coil region domain-containing protein n=2 Tax=Phytophthora kernoviae TaxID=325452 RepID=A0A3R7J5N4_9STRA|nr:hypothetical protein G195_010816 [Phytophthora kernoviae 00238/432]KAG2506963.1 hypothetical protein JM16_009076 [Phytophthora kernoviae]RLN26299.1 hypothetical protein BBI17_009309 [Phytophthora kernoviae]
MSKTNVRAQSEQLFNLQVQGDKYARLLVEQKNRMRQLDDHWKKVHDELKELRLKRGESDQRGGGVNAVRSRMADEQRELMKLENRLSACRTRESKMEAYNAELRLRVDELRANRVLSQTAFEKNQRRLREIQKQMQETFRQSTMIVAERDRILSQASSLSGQNVDEQEAFDQVFQSLASIIKREKESAESYRKQILEQDPMDLADDFVRGNMKLEDELQLKRTLQKLDLTMLEDKQNIASINEKLQEFETTFTALQQEMGVDDYHELVEVYSRKEEENFALFRYVQSTNNEVEQLEDEKCALEKEIQKLKNDMQDGGANARKRMVDDLVDTRQKILKENAEVERLRAAAAREFQPLARVVDRLYNALGCNDIMPGPPLMQLRNAQENNQRINLRWCVDKQTPSTNVLSTCIAEDEPETARSDDEDGDRPLTRVELQKRFLPTAFGWWDNGHMLVGEVASQLMDGADVTTIQSVLTKWEDDFPNTAELATTAVWPDLIKCTSVTTDCQTPASPSFTAMGDWHYINLPVNINGEKWEGKDADLTLFQDSLGGDGMSVIESAMKSFKTTKSNWAANLLLRNFIHIFGDLHQPLHTVAGISEAFPKGDGGGNSEIFDSPCAFSNLHALWDAAGGVYSLNDWALNIDDFKPTLQSNASELIALIPSISDSLNFSQYENMTYSNFYTAMVTNSVLREVALETYSYTESVVYSSLNLNATSSGKYPCPSEEYMAMAGIVSQRRIAIGGSRLATILQYFAAQLRELGLAD